MALTPQPHVDFFQRRAPAFRRWLCGWGGPLSVLALLAGCSTPAPSPSPPPLPPASEPAPPPAVVAPPVTPAAPEPVFTGKVSHASNERDYRRDGALHLYELYQDRIFRGKLPPLIQAVGVMRVHIGPNGEVRQFEWMRAPDHVPHVKAEIERLVHAAAPYPAPQRLGAVIYTDTWLWDRSGTFQLDTLTEGQLDRLPADTARTRRAAVRACKSGSAQKQVGKPGTRDQSCRRTAPAAAD